MQLAGKVAIVTGSSRGIGKAIAKAYAKEGAQVVVTARTEDESQSKLPGSIRKTVEEIVSQGGKATAIKCDLTKDEDMENLIKVVLDRFGSIDVLMNNAGILFHSSVVDTTVKRLDLILKINLRAPYVLCKLVVPTMAQQGEGSIINMTSDAALSAHVEEEGVHYTPYGMTKAGLERLTMGLAEEVKQDNIAVNSLDPGGIKTEAAVYLYPEDFDWTGWREPEVVGPSAIFLAAQTAKTFTGRRVSAEEFGKTWP